MGLLERLFGGKKNQQSTPSKPETNGSKEFFLDADDAKTLGNIEYMRTPKAIKKTFPATGGSKEIVEVVEVMSSIEKITDQPPSSPTASSPASQNSASGDRRRSDASLEMFRNMAKDLKK
jgi:hypothetical protein